jgi:tetratricopeptide (TPR) repeat protein
LTVTLEFLVNTLLKLTGLVCLLTSGLFFSISLSAENSIELDYFKRAIKRDPGDLQAHLNYQRILLQTGDGVALKQEYRARLHANPQDAAFIYLYGRLHEEDSQKRAFFFSALQADSSFFQAQFELGKIYYYAGEYSDAIVRYRMAARLKPKSAVVANLLGLAYYHSGYPGQAIVEYQKAIENDPSFADAYLNLGLTYYYTDQLDEAIETHTAALKHAKWHDDQHLLHHNLGMVYRKQGHIDKAGDAYREALKLNPSYSDAYISLGNLDFYRENYAQAIEAFQNAIGSPSENADLHLRLGLAYFNTRVYPKAILHFRQTLDLDSTNIQTNHYLGRAYYLNDQPEKAIEALETFIAKETRREKRPRVAEAKTLIFDIQKERFTDLLK